MKKIYFRNVIGNGLVIRQLIFLKSVLSYVDNKSLANGKTGKSITIKNRSLSNL